MFPDCKELEFSRLGWELGMEVWECQTVVNGSDGKSAGGLLSISRKYSTVTGTGRLHKKTWSLGLPWRSSG